MPMMMITSKELCPDTNWCVFSYLLIYLRFCNLVKQLEFLSVIGLLGNWKVEIHPTHNKMAEN